MSRSLIALLASTSLLAACATIPKLGEAPKLATSTDLASERALQAPAAAWPADRWWTVYGDAQLNALMDQALAGSPTLAEAQARLRSAQALAEKSRASLLPSLTANAQGGEAKQSYNNGIPPAFVPKGYNDTGRTSLDLSYDLDLWGRNRASLQAAVSTAEAARMDAAQVRLTLTASIATAYADFARLNAERQAAAAALQNREASAQLVAHQVAGGAANAGEASQARAAAASARQDLASLDEQLAIARDQLAALAGAGPDRGLDLKAPAATMKTAFGLPPNLAADLLGRRPDLQAARLRAEAAARRIDVARAGFYPNINLTAFIGVQSIGLSNLTKSGSDIGQAQAALSLPIFDGGALRGTYRGARADYDLAVATYNSTLVQALQQVADAAAGERALGGRLAAAREALAQGEEAYRIARLRYEGGLSNYLTLLTAEDSVITQRRAVAQLEARALTLDANLVLALGGGFRA